MRERERSGGEGTMMMTEIGRKEENQLFEGGLGREVVFSTGRGREERRFLHAAWWNAGLGNSIAKFFFWLWFLSVLRKREEKKQMIKPPPSPPDGDLTKSVAM